MMETRLSNLTYGFQNIVDEIYTEFDQSAPWQDRKNSSLGTFIVDVMAALYTNAAHNMDIAQLENYLVTARRDTSVYAMARSLGVKLNRRTSARTQVRITNNSNAQVAIEPYEPFSVGGRQFYNREGVILGVRESRTLTLYQGEVRLFELDLSTRASTSPEVLIGQDGFVIANEDVHVFTRHNNTQEYTEWSNFEGSIYELGQSDAAFIEGTTGDGDLSLLFGNGTFGRALPTDQTLVVQYIISAGRDGNVGQTGTQVQYPGNTLVTGRTLEPITGGTFPKDAAFYKFYAPHAYQSRKRWVRPADWVANIMLYPGVADATIQSQRDIAPNDPSWMNVVRICVLPSNSATWGGDNPNPTSALWNDFKAWAQERVGPHLVIQSYNPRKILVNLSVEITVQDYVDLKEMESTLRAALIELFQRRPGMLGKRLSISDVSHVCKVDPSTNKVRPGVDYVSVINPETDIIPESKLEYITLNSLKVFVKYTEREGS